MENTPVKTNPLHEAIEKSGLDKTKSQILLDINERVEKL